MQTFKRMRTGLLTVILFFTVFAVNAQKTKQVTIKTTSYCSHFDQCETGKSFLEKELAFTKGIKDIQFDLTAMTVTVTYNSKKTNPEKIKAAIAKAGYKADDVNADPKGYARLDGCCQKSE